MAANIRRYRELADMYQSDLGKALGVSAQAVSKWELGKAEPDGECILKMCKIFGITADELLGREPEKTAAPETELDERLMGMLVSLSPEQTQRVLDFVAGMKAADQA